MSRDSLALSWLAGSPTPFVVHRVGEVGQFDSNASRDVDRSIHIVLIQSSSNRPKEDLAFKWVNGSEAATRLFYPENKQTADGLDLESPKI
ncbi:hypothetical protein RRG08_034703 [Elysia crispata]|uniref:Uncharacterized protein n=1 Tax=Elysia crispata TaxID=231223 RepID=A0AAE1D850_9GAST|nr:hypothetical protein RRG08_034703 [Elysia crispata]